MSNRIDSQNHKDINELIAAKNKKEAEAKYETELNRQKKIITNDLLPFLREFSTSVTESKVLVNNTLKLLNNAFKSIMEEEQRLKSGKTIEELGVPERVEREENTQRIVSMINKVKNEKISTAVSILSTVHVLIAGAEAKESSQRNLKDLNIEV